VISVIRNVSNIYNGRKVKEITNQNMQSTETDKKDVQYERRLH